MQTKTIEKNIKVKLNDWLTTIEDVGLRLAVKESALVSGGCVASMFLNESVNDYDVYLMNIDVCENLAKYYTKSFESVQILDGRDKDSLMNDYKKSAAEEFHPQNSYGVSLRNLKPNQIKLYFKNEKSGLLIEETEENKDKKYRPLFFSANAISLSDNLQIVLRFGGTPQDVHETFDYIHATNYFTFDTGLVLNQQALESLLTKQLKYQGSHYPITSIIRAKKFIKRGFNINAGELLKIMYQISLLDLNNPDILEEQLIGVDVAYFGVLIHALRNKFESEKDFKLTSAYFNNLIDKIFNESNDETDLT